MIFFLSVFGVLALGATFLFFSNRKDDEVIEEVKEEEKFEPQNSNYYINIDDTNLESDKADVHTLIKYSLGLYGLAIDDYEIEGDMINSYGKINKITDKENIPINDLETNSREFLNSEIVRISYDEIIVKKNKNFYKFYRIGD